MLLAFTFADECVYALPLSKIFTNKLILLFREDALNQSIDRKKCNI